MESVFLYYIAIVKKIKGMMIMQKNAILLTRISIIAVFTALCFSMTFIQIKMPTGDMVHLGNFVMILAALLLGGLEGGFVGSLGMGLYDLIYYSSKPSTIIRTFVLKFLVGFLVGFFFQLVLKKKIKTGRLLLGSAIFFFLLSGITFTLFFLGDYSNLSFLTGYVSNIQGLINYSKAVNLSLYVPLFSLIFGVFMLVSFILNHKFSDRSKAALFAITIAILVNILGEFLLRWSLEGFFNVVVSEMPDGFSVSLLTATSKIPGSLITGFISVILATIVYEPVYHGVKHLNFFKKENDADIESEDSEEASLEEAANIQ